MNRRDVFTKKILKKAYSGCLATALVVMSFSGCSGKTEKSAGSTETTTGIEAESIDLSTEKETPDSSVLKDNDVGITVDSDGFTIMDDYVKVIDDGVNVRVKPSTDADIYVILEKGVDLHRTGEKDGWTRVRLNGSSFYISSNYVEKTEIDWKQNEKREAAHIVYIDPSKQIMADSDKEPVGPGSEETKDRMSSPGIGVSTGNFEYDITLSLARKIKSLLETRGYIVILSRDSSSISMSNRERALLANTTSAEVYIKLQAGTASPEVNGMMGFVITKNNPYNSDDYDKSYELCSMLLDNASAAAGSGKRGIVYTDKLTVLNHCSMPAAVINIGFLSNQDDDKKLAEDAYLDKIAEGIADGCDEYFNKEKESGGGQSSVDENSDGQSSGDQPADGQSGENQAADGQSGEDTSSGEQPVDGQSGDDQPTDGQSGEDQAADGQSGEDTSSGDQPADGQSGEDQSGGEQ